MEIIKLNLIPNGVNPTCHCSQYDEGRAIRIELFDGLTPYTLQSGDTVTLNVRKPDNTIVTTTVETTQGNNYVDIVTTEQICACVGYNLCDLTITNGSVVIGTLNFIMAVERDVLADGIPSQSVIEDLDVIVNDAVQDMLELYNYYNVLPTEELSGSIASFDDGADDIPVKSLIVGIEPKQAGSGDPSPSNVRQISGWSACNLFVNGKNLLNTTISGIKAINTSGTWNGNVYTYANMTFTLEGNGDILTGIKINGTSNSSYAYFYLSKSFCAKGGQTYSISGSPSGKGSATFRVFCESNKAFASGNRLSDDSAANKTRTATASEENIEVFIQVFANQQMTNAYFYPQIELSNQATTYESYKGTTHNISLGQTVYGGILNITTGELKVTKKEYILTGSETWVAWGDAYYCSVLSPQAISNNANKNAISEKLPSETTSSLFSGNVGIGASGSNIYIDGSSYSNIASFTGMKVVYELATPIIIQLTPTQVNTLLAVNNIFADTGDVIELLYKSDIGIYFSNLIINNRSRGVLSQSLPLTKGSAPLIVEEDPIIEEEKTLEDPETVEEPQEPQVNNEER